MWEDMCYRAGPLLSPKCSARCWSRSISASPLDSRNTVWTWSSSTATAISRSSRRCGWRRGVNTMFPLEIGAWGADPVAYRRQYGRDLLMVGGVGKRILAGPKRDHAGSRAAGATGGGGRLHPDARPPRAAGRAARELPLLPDRGQAGLGQGPPELEADGRPGPQRAPGRRFPLCLASGGVTDVRGAERRCD